jgi:GrpB-like predicted nucleotidyltransferase (UPF0157 family)
MSETIVEYDPHWPAQFEREAERLRTTFGSRALRIERIDHIGSTAVVGLAAKPIIDIQVVLPDRASIDTCWELLAATDYTIARIPIEYLHKPVTWPHSHHVHLRTLGSDDEQRFRLFRDWLRSHAADRAAYAQLKRALAQHADLTNPQDRVRYSEAKTQFVREIERRAGLRTGASVACSQEDGSP